MPEVLARIGTEVELVDATPADAPEWVRDVVAEHGGGFREFAEGSRSHVLRAAYYLGASFVTTYPVLRWQLGAADRPEVRQPVVTGFASGEDLPVVGAAEALLAGVTSPRRSRAGATPSAADDGARARRPARARPRVRRPRSCGTTRQRWPAWIDGFGHLHKLEGEWPELGARAVWDSRPGGRGRVVEQVTAYEARVGQTLAVEDEKLRGTQRVAFEPGTGGVEVSLELEYELKGANAFTPITDALFIRRALRDSLKRTLLRFARERRGDIEAA